MILICPSCAKRYRLAPGAIGPAGRQVRCHACGHAWHALPEHAEPPEAAPPRRAEPEPPPVPPPPLPPRPAPAPTARRMPRPAAMLAWLAVAVLLGLGGLAWLGRDWLVGLAPGLGRYYAGLGIEVTTAPSLEIRNQITERRLDGERELLIVRGEVHNPAADARDVPAVRVALLDGKGAEVAFALVNAQAGRLEGGAAASFEATIPDPPATAESYRVTLVEG